MDKKEVISCFLNKVNNQGYNVYDADIKACDESHFCVSTSMGNVKVPYLQVYARGLETYNRLKDINEGMGLANNEQAEIIRSIWRESCIECKVDLTQFYYRDMYIGLDRIEKVLLLDYVYVMKEQVSNVLKDTLGCRPVSVYANSMPGYNAYGLARED